MKIDQSIMTPQLPIMEPTVGVDPSKSLDDQIFDQLVTQSITEMEKRQGEIKENLEKLNENDA